MREYLITYLGGEIPERLQNMSKPTHREQALAQGRLFVKAGAQRVKVEEITRTVIMDVGPEPCSACQGATTVPNPSTWEAGPIQCRECEGSGRQGFEG